ncbi:MAG: hypothetical protein COU66_03810 [Candidatus Pacebacteria bacterium CG10_big_fil_rev_8_21_14_0_10_44_11]|nr:MAG: hypothetical protein COU66_03810 [Candidatus Pacebacteria bacterium CG10_big_fil_rev_8_21_14_0_10_44_11]
MNYTGVIIEESLGDSAVLTKVKITETKVEPITPEHKTPWLRQWTLRTVEISEKDGGTIAEEISKSFDPKHPVWYADFKNEQFHFIIFNAKVFKIDLHHPILYKAAKEYGISIGIPEYQLDFFPEEKVWE